jgi:hypothetical protein
MASANPDDDEAAEVRLPGMRHHPLGGYRWHDAFNWKSAFSYKPIHRPNKVK